MGLKIIFALAFILCLSASGWADTMGETSTSATGHDAQDIILLSGEWSPDASGTVTSIHAYVYVYPNADVILGIWADEAGSDDDTLIASDTIAVTGNIGGGQWIEGTIDCEIDEAKTYYLGGKVDATGLTIGYIYDKAASGDSIFYEAASGALSSPLVRNVPWDFSIFPTGNTDVTYCDDSYMDDSEPTTAKGTNSGIHAGYNYDTRTGWVAFWGLSDSLALSAYNTGDVDSGKIAWTISTAPGVNDTVSYYLFAIKMTPVEATMTWNVWGAFSWQTAGAKGSNDRYTPRETDGVHTDSLLLHDGYSAENIVYTWINPDHILQEDWILEYSYKDAADNAYAVFYASDAYGTKGPAFYAYGNGPIVGSHAIVYVTYSAGGGVPNYIHGPDGVGIIHGPDGGSVRH